MNQGLIFTIGTIIITALKGTLALGHRRSHRFYISKFTRSKAWTKSSLRILILFLVRLDKGIRDPFGKSVKFRISAKKYLKVISPEFKVF